jgi:hypothetical protein|tara:strand:+ start:185 stop:1063 length:879 start_codon:yes stop_codon:yes gene_type:complete
VARILKWTGLVVLVGVVLLLVVYGRYVSAILNQPQMFLPPAIDEELPALPRLAGRVRVLAFSKTNAFRHHEAIPAAGSMLEALAVEHGWGLAQTENGAAFSASVLEGIDVVVLNNCTGRLFNEAQQSAFQRFVERGGGVVALHAAGDSSYEWGWWVDELIRARFLDHPMTLHIQDATLHNEGVTHPLTAHLGATWQLADEWYNFDHSPRSRVEVLLRIDEQTYDPERSPMGDDHPVLWWHALGDGRVVYSALGHVPGLYKDPDYRQLIRAAVDWTASGERTADAYRTDQTGH